MHCSIEGCEKPVRARGWCVTHHQRWRVHGDPLVCNRPKPVPGYAAMHDRMGKASDHNCSCGAPALDWAYNHDDPDEVTDERGRRYSLDPAHYRPSCRSCNLKDIKCRAPV